MYVNVCKVYVNVCKCMYIYVRMNMNVCKYIYIHKHVGEEGQPREGMPRCETALEQQRFERGCGVCVVRDFGVLL